MSGNTCGYDCSVTPKDIPSYLDISGLGVVIGYVATAFFVVVITSSYYIFAYQPLYPFRKADGTDDQTMLSQYRSNPIDKLLLHYLAKWLPRRSEAGNASYSRLEKALIKCVLNMSDLQIITGLSILINGFSQLRCGLSAYHWQILVYLAWFSSLTHLCCLTFLRNYLFNHPGQRLWRLASMFGIVIMLVVALVPTGSFDWYDFGVGSVVPSSYAICSYRIKPWNQSNSYVNMIISSLLLLFGFLTRVTRLYKALSIGIFLYLRSFCSRIAHRGLQNVYDWCRVPEKPQSLRRSFIYHPLLAVFLMVRVFLDIYSSMFMEVWWLLVGFSWGMVHLVSALQLSPVGTKSSDWTFGQVIPVVLLAAPAVAIVEFLYEDDEDVGYGQINTFASNAEANSAVQGQAQSPTPLPGINQVSNAPNSGDSYEGNRRVETLQIAENLSNSSIEGLRDEPDFDFYIEATWFIWIVMYFLCSICIASIYIIVYAAFGGPMAMWVFYPPGPRWWWEWSPLDLLVTVWSLVLFIISFEDFRLLVPEFKGQDAFWKSANTVLIAYFLFQLLVFAMGLPMSDFQDIERNWLFIVVPVELYFAFAGFRARNIRGFLVGVSFLVAIVSIAVYCNWPQVVW